MADIQPYIVASLRDCERFLSLATAYAQQATALVLISSKIYDIFDLKWLYFDGVVCFKVGRTISDVAATMNLLVLGLAIADVGGRVYSRTP